MGDGVMVVVVVPGDDEPRHFLQEQDGSWWEVMSPENVCVAANVADFAGSSKFSFLRALLDAAAVE